MDASMIPLDGSDPIVVALTWLLTLGVGKLIDLTAHKNLRHALPGIAVLLAVAGRALLDVVIGQELSADVVWRGLAAGAVAVFSHAQFRELLKARTPGDGDPPNATGKEFGAAGTALLFAGMLGGGLTLQGCKAVTAPNKDLYAAQLEWLSARNEESAAFHARHIDIFKELGNTAECLEHAELYAIEAYATPYRLTSMAAIAGLTEAPGDPMTIPTAEQICEVED